MKARLFGWMLVGLGLVAFVGCGGDSSESATEVGGDDGPVVIDQEQVGASTTVETGQNSGQDSAPEPVDDYVVDVDSIPEEDRDDFDQFVSDVQKGLTVAAQIKALVENAYEQRGVIPQSAKELGASARGMPSADGVRSVNYVDGKIIVDYEAHGNHPAGTIEMEPVAKGSSLAWDCTGGSLLDQFRPADCR